MEKDFDEFVAKRCEKALLENEQYMRLENSDEVSRDELQALAETLCYKKCFNDFVAKINM